MPVIFFFAYLVLTLFFACSPNGGPSQVDQDQKAFGDRDGQLTRALVQDLVTPKFSEMNAEISALASSFSTTCVSTGSAAAPIDAHQLSVWQEQWARAAWNFHYLNVLVYGPLTQVQESTPLRFIYSHSPLRAPSLIEREIAKASEQKAAYKQPRPLAHSLGFQALEYLLFARPMQSSTGSFDEGACHFTNYVLNDLRQRLQDYEQQWLETEVSYLLSPEGQTRLPEVIGRLAGHVIVHTREVLYRRAALAPLGLDPELIRCPSVEVCVEEHLEHPFATDRKMKLSAGLQALEDLFNGRRLPGGGFSYSFRDYFVHLQNSQNHPLDQIPEVKRTWQALPSYDQLLEAEVQGATVGVIQASQDFLDRFEALNLWLSTDLLVDLNANLPKTVKGDND